jgi:hypothetical protein
MTRAERIADIEAASPTAARGIEEARARKDAVKALFGDLVQRLEMLVPRRTVINAMRDALEMERTVDEMIAAADAEESTEN